VDPRIIALCRQAPCFAYEAYEFVCEAVTFTMKRLDRGKDETEDAAPDQHVSGSELLRGVCDLAVREFGMMAPVVFKRWGVRTTDDVGKMVFNLIEVQLLSKSDRDAPEDFHELFDLHETLANGFELRLDAGGQPAKRNER
jgi:uncharacterized repeat protein (TIGR04138 family)